MEFKAINTARTQNRQSKPGLFGRRRPERMLPNKVLEPTAPIVA